MEYISNRQIKFRVFALSTKRMVYGTDKEMPIVQFNGMVMGARSEDYILMQFTGLHDKNGKEIWEGDVVQYEKTTSKTFRRLVSHDFGAFGYFAGRSPLDETGKFYPLGFRIGNAEDNDHWQVIGNIYENPDLITKQEIKS